MKKLIYLLLLAVLVCSFQQANAQETGSAKTKPDTVKTVASASGFICRVAIDKADTNHPLVVLNNEIIEYAGIKGIDPNKISTISILKDASATALYGQQAKNGVIIISTKDYVPKKTIK